MQLGLGSGPVGVRLPSRPCQPVRPWGRLGRFPFPSGANRLWRGWRPLGSRGRRGHPGQQDSQHGWCWVVRGGLGRGVHQVGNAVGQGVTWPSAPCLGRGLSSFPLLRPAAALRPRIRPSPSRSHQPLGTSRCVFEQLGWGPSIHPAGLGSRREGEAAAQGRQGPGGEGGIGPSLLLGTEPQVPPLLDPPHIAPRKPGPQTWALPPNPGPGSAPSGNWRADLACPWDPGFTGPCGWWWLSAVCRPVCNTHVGSGVQVPRAAPPPTRSTPSLLRLPCCTVMHAVGGGCVLFAPVFLMGRLRLGSGPLVPTH